jgi:N-methylhydantoinase A
VHAVYELRYAGQSFELAIPAEPEATPEELRDAFEREHEERYGYHDAEQELELVTIRVTATAQGTDVALAGEDSEPEPGRSTREAILAGERVELEVLRGIPAPGAKVDGPAVVELPESTLLVPSGWSAEVDDTGTLRMERCG